MTSKGPKSRIYQIRKGYRWSKVKFWCPETKDWFLGRKDKKNCEECGGKVTDEAHIKYQKEKKIS